MRIPRAALAAAMCFAAAASLAAGQYLVPRMPPPKTSVYDFADLGPAPAVSCSCVPNPFALPANIPFTGMGSGLAAPFEPPPISDADRATNKAWYEQEGKDLPRIAEDSVTGNPNASLRIADHLSLYKTIIGPDEHVERVEADVVRWLTLAAQQGHRDAYRLLGQRYAHGWGAKQDDAVAAYWFDQGARHDDPISMTAIGFLFAAGRGVEQDWSAAITWWQRAATRTPIASRFLGDAYACGVGVGQDSEHALRFYRQGDASSGIQAGHMYLRGCPREDDKAAVASFRGAAEQGFPEAQIELSDLIRQGRGTEANPLEAYRWARIAERRLPPGGLKTRAAGRATAAARLLTAIEMAYEDRMIDQLIATAAQSLR